MSRPLQLLIISDGKPGHRNQSVGLAEALARLTPTDYRIIELDDWARGKKILGACHSAQQGPRPDWIIAAGHSTHLCALVLSRYFDARSIILMKPSLPLSLFDVCLIPRHDLKGRAPQSHVIPTTGALNRMTFSGSKEPLGLIMIGGDSKDYAFDSSELRDAITKVIRAHALDWHIADSRRTPADFLESLRDLPVTLHPHQLTGPDWLPNQLRRSEVAWVTHDSVSMIYEALSSGAMVGVLPMHQKKTHSKISRAIEELAQQGYLTTFKGLQENNPLLKCPPFAEADRCAEILLHQFSTSSS